MMEFLTPIIINLTRIVISAFVTYLCVANNSNRRIDESFVHIDKSSVENDRQ
jgi:hypothetical protein